MTLFVKFVRNLAHHRFRTTKISSINSLPKHCRNFHCTSNLSVKLYTDHENQYAYSILENKGHAMSLNNSFKTVTLSENQFKNLIESDWSKKLPGEIFETFSVLSSYCSENNICISHTMFDNYIDSLTDSLKFATDDQLKSIFYSLDKWPEPQSIKTRNYVEVWVALDDQCINRCLSWSHNENLSFIGLFYMLNATRHSDFCMKILNKLAYKAKQLLPEQFVKTMFYIGVWRRSPFDMHNMEIQLKACFSKFSINDLAIISMGFFKTKTAIRDTDLVLKIIDSVIENSKNIHEVSLAALLKLIRYSTKFTPDDRIQKLLETLQYEVPRLSIMCNVHIAQLGTTTINLHKGCLSTIAENVIDSLSQTRLKDLERLVLTFATFNYKPQTKDCFFTKVIDELRKPERMQEIMSHGRAFACCLAYLSILNIYPEDLITKAFTNKFLLATYGKYCYNYGKEILMLHYMAEIYCKNVSLSSLDYKAVKIMAKRYTDYVPSDEYKKQYNITEKMVIDIVRVLRELRGGPQYVHGDHILPYHQRGDLIICDDHNGTPVDIKDAFPPEDFGLLRKPPNDLNWTVLVIAGRNSIIYGTDATTGPFISKIRDLEVIGYNATLVPWTNYRILETDQEKVDFLNDLIKKCRKNKRIK